MLFFYSRKKGAIFSFYFDLSHVCFRPLTQHVPGVNEKCISITFFPGYLDSIRIYLNARIANSQAWAEYEFAQVDMTQWVVRAVYVI